MQGFILRIAKVRDQDLIVSVLTSSKILQAYRFYGMRHSIIALGRKIDFDLQYQGVYLPKICNLIQLGYAWEQDYSRVYVWQFVMRLLSKHLVEVQELPRFYYDLLEQSATKMQMQNPMRVALEMSAEIVEYEGRSARLQSEMCFLCGRALQDGISLGRSFLFAHPQCAGGYVFKRHKIIEFLSQRSSIGLDDLEVEHLWNVFALGL
ncbi:recombination protein RecO [Helicobacter enhydrae]|uniref:Recombination protein RecO n=1 Tax=Helicobacter enhydrae TaxID=222136 RepID=A0A1B1U6B7_9HELI|nr:recombination protein RecO [Helicobacter enhydrae]ANV98286.1 recombination protein RecO [Helicobacter enhydrae]